MELDGSSRQERTDGGTMLTLSNLLVMLEIELTKAPYLPRPSFPPMALFYGYHSVNFYLLLTVVTVEEH